MSACGAAVRVPPGRTWMVQTLGVQNWHVIHRAVRELMQNDARAQPVRRYNVRTNDRFRSFFDLPADEPSRQFFKKIIFKKKKSVHAEDPPRRDGAHAMIKMRSAEKVMRIARGVRRCRSAAICTRCDARPDPCRYFAPIAPLSYYARALLNTPPPISCHCSDAQFDQCRERVSARYISVPRSASSRRGEPLEFS